MDVGERLTRQEICNRLPSWCSAIVYVRFHSCTQPVVPFVIPFDHDVRRRLWKEKKMEKANWVYFKISFNHSAMNYANIDKPEELR